MLPGIPFLHQPRLKQCKTAMLGNYDENRRAAPSPVPAIHFPKIAALQVPKCPLDIFFVI
jgi:hypothetical protein